VAKALFFANSLTVRKRGDYLVLQAQMKCQHGKVLDEVFLTLPGQLTHLFTSIEDACDNTVSGEGLNKTNSLAERFKRFSNDN
jgi:hypothetical protein